MKCCAGCFSHPWLRDLVNDEGVPGKSCDYCDAKDTKVLDIYQLCDPFRNLMSVYVPADEAMLVEDLSPEGEPLIDLIQEDYEVFSDDLICNAQAERLLNDILRLDWDDDSGDAYPDAGELYVRRGDQWGRTRMAEEWAEYCANIKDHSHCKYDFGPSFAEELERLTKTLNVKDQFFRARLGYEHKYEPYKGAAIGAPPKNRAKPGRGNKGGEVVLYVADEAETAVAEVRPARGNLVSLATLSAKRQLRIVDLTSLPRTANPFVDEAPEYEQELEALLAAFAEELARPLQRSDDCREYRPSQMLIHRIREAGYDGVRYPSAMSLGGKNLVLFDPMAAEVGPSQLFKVHDLHVKFKPFIEET